VFILSRMREEYDRTGSTDDAVIAGLGRTGRLVTSAALILFLAFVALAASPGTEIRTLATGLRPASSSTRRSSARSSSRRS
jgi:putative drug exporter of the RND superfamily